jgi:hypothetical protein
MLNYTHSPQNQANITKFTWKKSSSAAPDSTSSNRHGQSVAELASERENLPVLFISFTASFLHPSCILSTSLATRQAAIASCMYALSSMEQLVASPSPMQNVSSSWRAEARTALDQSAGTEVVEERAGTDVLEERTAGLPARRESAMRRP